MFSSFLFLSQTLTMVYKMLLFFLFSFLQLYIFRWRILLSNHKNTDSSPLKNRKEWVQLFSGSTNWCNRCVPFCKQSSFFSSFFFLKGSTHHTTLLYSCSSTPCGCNDRNVVVTGKKKYSPTHLTYYS